MAEEIDAGRIVAEIVLETKQARETAEEISEEIEKLDRKKASPAIVIDTSQAKDGVNKLDSVLDNVSSKSVTPVIDVNTRSAVDAVKETEQVIDALNSTEIKPKLDYETLSYIKGSLEEMGITGREMVDVLNAGFGNLTEAKRYRVALEEIALKIDECRTKMQALNVGDNIDSGAVENYSDALTQLEDRYDKVLAKLDEYVAKTVNAVQKSKNIENEINELSGSNAPTFFNNETMLQAQSYEDTIIYIRGVLEKLKITGKDADNIISACFNDVSALRKYQNELEVIAGKLETERKKYQELAAAKDRAEKRGDYSSVEKITSAMDDQVNKIKTLEARFDSVYEKQDNAVKKTVMTYQKQSSAAENAQVKQDKLNKTLDNKQAGKNFSGGVNLATTSLRTLNAIAPDTVDGIGEIITQINAAKQAMTAGASAPIAWATAIVASIGVVASLVINEIQKVQQAEEEARQKAAEAASEYAQSSENLDDLAEQFVSLRSKLDKTNLSRKEEIEIKNELYQIQDELIKKYGLESNAVDLVTGSVKGQTKAIEELRKTEALDFISKSGSEYRDYKNEFENKNRYTISALKTFDGKSELGDISIDKLKEISEELNKRLSKIGGVESEIVFQRINGQLTGEKELVINVDVEGEKAKDKFQEIYSELDTMGFQGIDYGINGLVDKIKNAYTEAYNYNFDEAWNERFDVWTQGRQAEEVLNGTAENTEKTLQELQNEIKSNISLIDEYESNMESLASAYKTVSEGGDLNSSTLNELIDKYPAIAQYINETGDLTLKNGEIIKKAYEEERNTLVKKLNEEKKSLETAELSNEAKNDAKERIQEINAQLRLYNSELTDVQETETNVGSTIDWSAVAGEVKELSSAYQTLNEGKQLDVDTMLNLIDKYPEVASKMAQEGELGKDQAEIFKELAEARKNEYIVNQQVALKNLEVSRQETEEIIKNLQAQIMMYMLKGQIAHMMNVLPQLAAKSVDLNNINDEIDKAKARINAIKNIDVSSYGKSSGGSGSNTDLNTVSNNNTALANELKQLEHKKAIGQLTSKQEYDWLVRINDRYSKNADEQMDMEKRLYNAKKQMQADEEAANTKALQAAYKGIENKKSLGQMTSREELRQLEQIRQKYKMTADERMELEIKIYNLKKSLKDEEISSLNTLADAVTQALKEKYEEQKKIEQDRINESIESWQKWEDETVKAIQGEIDALDKLADKQESENKRQEYENKRQQTALQLAYEKDDYNRAQLQKELDRLDKEEAERLAEEQREAKKRVLQGRIEAVKGQSQATQERYKRELDELDETYDKLTDSFALKAQAQKFIAQSSQTQIVNLIKSYASDYEIAGNTVGDALYNGMKSKLDNIASYVESVFGRIEAYQKQVANTANTAADRFWRTQSRTNNSQTYAKTSAPKTVTVQQTVNFNQPVESPVETRRQLDRTSQALARQISNGL